MVWCFVCVCVLAVRHSLEMQINTLETVIQDRPSHVHLIFSLICKHGDIALTLKFSFKGRVTLKILNVIIYALLMSLKTLYNILCKITTE